MGENGVSVDTPGLWDMTEYALPRVCVKTEATVIYKSRDSQSWGHQNRRKEMSMYCKRLGDALAYRTSVSQSCSVGEGKIYLKIAGDDRRRAECL